MRWLSQQRAISREGLSYELPVASTLSGWEMRASLLKRRIWRHKPTSTTVHLLQHSDLLVSCMPWELLIWGSSGLLFPGDAYK